MTGRDMKEAGEIWRHVKTGGLYGIVDVDARLEATNEKAIVYTSLHDGITWIRPYAEFMDGRFEKAYESIASRGATEEESMTDWDKLTGEEAQTSLYRAGP